MRVDINMWVEQIKIKDILKNNTKEYPIFFKDNLRRVH